VASAAFLGAAPALLASALPLGAGQERAPDPARAPLEAGRAALAAGKSEAAYAHLGAALRLAPDDPAVLELVLAAVKDDPDARALWSLRWHEAAADADGEVRPSAATRELLAGDDPHPARLVGLRAKAVQELAAFARAREARGAKAPEELLVARWARRVALDLAGPLPAARRAAGALDPGLALPRDFHVPVLAALERAMASAFSSGASGAAARLASCLHGLGVQAGFQDLEGPRPSGTEPFRKAAAETLARARARLERERGEPWTIEGLEALGPEEAEAFTREHASLAAPARAISPRGWYRVETACGFETLLGVARTIEQHHERLARWYGTDPFASEPGLVRVVPEASDLEAEGTPFWWAGGFQSGATTTVRFACGTLEGLGHLLTHELTHRFDAALFPGQPAWLSEGKAVHTGGAYASTADPLFTDDHADFGALESAWNKGYGGLERLSELLAGTIDDYRDNYVAGYALYVYLATWEESGRKPFAPRLPRYMEGAGKAQDALSAFTAAFADGKEGRPSDLAAFARGFDEFLSGFYWRSPKAWAARYRDGIGRAGDGYVYDAPTWSWARVRAEPVFGQDQARLAGELLLERGRRAEALRACVWALAADGPTSAVEERLGRLLHEAGAKDAAWVVALEGALPSGTSASAPFLGALGRVLAYAQALEEASASYRAAGRVFAARALAADRERLGRWLGLASEPGSDAPARARHPFDEPERHAGAAGWREDGLTDHEERRVEGLWAVDGADLHVGRDSPRSGTGRFERQAAWQHAFVRAEEYLLPGRYRIRARIRFTTSYASGAVVLGYTRRDRNLRFSFTAGDFLYAIEETEAEPTFADMSWRLAGLRERDAHLAGSSPGGKHVFEQPSTSFEIELLVDWATLEAFVGGRRLGTYRTVDAKPIEGHLGFATGYGAILVQEPRVQRLERSWLERRSDEPLFGLDLSLPLATEFQELQNLPLAGVPRSPGGTLCLWIPLPALEEGEALDPLEVLADARESVDDLARIAERERLVQPVALIVPAAVGEERVRALAAELREAQARPPLVLTHALTAPSAPEERAPDRSRRWLLFLDPASTVRFAAQFRRRQPQLPPPLVHWLTVFREEGRPAREPAPPERGR
jgi:hypothetical protein